MKVGVQLYSVRESMMKDPIKTIDKVADLGYKYLEFANNVADKDPGTGLFLSADEMNQILKKSNTKAISAHISPLNMENIKAVLEYHSELGTKYIVYPMEFFTSKEQTVEFAKKLDKIGALAREHNISLLYHNHFHEFMEVEGEIILDILMENTHPKNLGLQMDTYWAMRSGNNPIDILKKYGERIKLIHQKDYPNNMEVSMEVPKSFNNDATKLSMEDIMPMFTKEHFTEIGRGIIDIQNIINTTKEYCDVDYIIVEQDFTSHDEIESIKISMQELKKLSGIDFS